MNAIHTFIKDESGVVAIEYGLLAALIAIPLIAGAEVVGERMNELFQQISRVLEQATNRG